MSALPQPLLAAVVLVAIAGLLNLSTLKELWLNYRSEFVVAMAAFAGVLTFGLLRGVMLGALISLVQWSAFHRAPTLLSSDEFPALAVSRIAIGMQTTN